MMRIGIVGYGAGGRYFHAPFVEAADGVELAGVVARSAANRAHVEQDHPGLPVYGSLAEMLATGVDAVTITTPPHTRRDLVLEAINAGVHVVADKPFAPTAKDARELELAANQTGVVLNVYHNRRRDADIITLANVLASGNLGELWRVHSTMDQDNADTLELGPSGGLLRDLGGHLVDQMLWLLGPASSVYATLDWTDRFRERTDCGFVTTMRHASGVVSTVSASKLNHSSTRELRAYGSNGSYVATGADVQAEALFAGRRPAAEPAEGIRTLEVLDAARESALRNAVISL
jgi:predicted dehydrogenase